MTRFAPGRIARHQDQRVRHLRRRYADPLRRRSEFYRALGMAYVEPELREDRGEIQAGLAGKLPALITEQDLRGILHVHSTWSDGAEHHSRDGRGHVRARQAVPRHLRPQPLRRLRGRALRRSGAPPAGGDRPSQRGVRRTVAHPQGHRVRHPQGRRARLRRRDAGDLRFRRRLDPQQLQSAARGADAAPDSALENPYFSMLGHPTGRVLLRREGYEPDLERVIERGRARRGRRAERRPEPLRPGLAVASACHRAWNPHPNLPDAHSPGGLLNIRYGVGIARKGWLTVPTCSMRSNATTS